jgi:hypothetical protein
MQHIHLSMQDLNQIVIAEMNRGKTCDDMIAYLRERGWPENSARKFIANATDQHANHVQSAQDAAREAEQDDPFTIDDRQQHFHYALFVAAIGLTLIAVSMAGGLMNLIR